MPMRLLTLLVEHAGETVTRDQARRHLWSDNTFVEFDNNLGVAVGKLREALRDSVSAPIYIETIPRRGYRFIAPVSALSLQETSLVPEQTDAPAEAVPLSLTEPSREVSSSEPLPAPSFRQPR